MVRKLLSFSSILILSFSLAYASDKQKTHKNNDAKKRQILRNIANEAKKPSPDVQKKLMLRGIAQEARRPQYIKFLNILPKAIEIDESLKNANLTYEASVDDAKASRSAIYPDATLTLTGQEQDDVKPDAANDQYTQREVKFEIKQSLYDFGENRAAIATSDLQSEQKFLGINAARNAAILGAAQSYIGLKGAQAQLKIALESEARLKKQTGMQDFRVQRGAAVKSDVLQAKNALAGAVAARVMAQGGYELAANDFENKFGFVPQNAELLLPINIPNSLIPKNRKEYRDAVFKNGDQFKQAQIAYKIAQIAADKAFAENFLPSLDFTGTAHYKGNNAGTRGGKTEYIAKVELSMPIELFGTQFNKYSSSVTTGKSAGITFNQAKRTVENTVNSNWINYLNSKMNQSNVANQVEIARQFLTNAQMAVKQGRGEMILVVNAQNALVNAQKSLESTNTNFAVQIYSMLSDMGSLSVKNLKKAVEDDLNMRKQRMETQMKINKKRMEERNKKIREFQKNLKKNTKKKTKDN